jgi:phosphoadenosine phosphosulfate reductase
MPEIFTVSLEGAGAAFDRGAETAAPAARIDLYTRSRDGAIGLDPRPFAGGASAGTAQAKLEHSDGIVRAAIERHPGRIALACSFGGPTGMVLLDLVRAIDATVPVYFLDTGLLFAETYDLVRRVRERYGAEPIAVRPELTVPEQAERFGDALWARDPDACCALRKVQPQRAFLEGYDAWFTGLRRDQAATRRNVAFEELDDANPGLEKIAPLADWSEAEVWSYVVSRDVPYNPLNDRGYPSVGCTHCTRTVAPGEDPRAGRWSGFTKTECGLHPPKVE